MSAPAAGPAKHTAEVTLPCGSAEKAEWVRRAIQAEVDEAPDGASCTLTIKGGDLCAEVHASDLAGLRAALNTLVRLADAALGTVQAKGRT
ncbi:MAG: KEOPS complex subunit Pcc1 [Candidatus Thermoplasmatota archaeon]|jgi:tRNA threonylcarbamoyladenosine modification (KEOPS) complex  Pcc1 subunit